MKKLTFAIFSVPHIPIIAGADCMPITIVAFGVLMACVSVAWVRFCKRNGQCIHCMVCFTNRAL